MRITSQEIHEIRELAKLAIEVYGPNYGTREVKLARHAITLCDRIESLESSVCAAVGQLSGITGSVSALNRSEMAADTLRNALK